MGEEPVRDWAAELVDRARTEGVELTGDNGLLTVARFDRWPRSGFLWSLSFPATPTTSRGADDDVFLAADEAAGPAIGGRAACAWARARAGGGWVSSRPATRAGPCSASRWVRIGDPEKFRQEDAMRDRARSALDPDDEAEARAVADLVGRYAAHDRVDSSAAAALKEEVRSVGRRLCRAGGSDRLKLVAYRVQELSPGNTYGTVRSMESFWDGICGWQV